jgi:hypothetical protein
MPTLTASEWRDVQAAVRAIEAQCDHRRSGVWRGLARLIRPRPAANDDGDTLQRFLCAGARHDNHADDLARQLEQRGFSPAQIAAVALIAG